MNKQQTNIDTKIKPGLSWGELNDLGVNYEPYINNKNYKSVKIMNQKTNYFYYHYILFFYNEILTHIQIFSSSANNKNSECHILNSWLNDHKKKELMTSWKTMEIIHDEKINSSYIICR